MNSVPIEDVAEIFNGFAFDSDYFNSTGKGLPIVRIRDVVPGFSETYYSGAFTEEYLLQNGDLLIGMDGEFNIATWKGGKALLNQRVCKVTPKAGIADKSFLKHRLAVVLKGIEANTPFVTVKHLSSEDLKQSEIELPALPEQHRIAAILDRADRLRRTRRYAAQLSESFLQAVFVRMFGDPVRNPMGWESESIEELCDKVIDYRGRTPPYSEGGIRHITASCIKDSRIDWTQCKYVNEQTYREYMTRGFPERGDVLFTTEAPLGETALVDTDEQFSLAQRIVLLRPAKEKLRPHYLNSLLSHPRFFGRLIQYATGSTVVGIRSESLIAIPIPAPPLALQEKFARSVQQFERLRAQQRESERQAEHLFQTLLHRAFGGEV